MITIIHHKHSEANYTVVNTGYTGRIARRYNFIPYKIEGRKCPEDNISSDDDSSDDCDDFYKRYEPIFIYDNIWGKGLYTSPCIDVDAYHEDIRRIISILTDKSGIIVFRGNRPDTDYVSLVKRLDYCRCFNVMETEFVIDTHDGFNLVIIHVDSESG